MKFTTTLFSLAVVATTTTDNGVHCMSDDMDNTTDTTTAAAASASSDGEGGFREFMSGVRDEWNDFKTGMGCLKEAKAMYAANEALDSAWMAWDSSLEIDEVLSTGGGNSSYSYNTSAYSYTSAYSAETTATYKEECEKITGNTFTSTPDRSFSCTMEGDDKGVWYDSATVDVSNNGACIPDSENCNSMMADLKELNLTAVALADDSLYHKMITEKDIYCNEMEFDDSGGGVVPSTTFLGSVVAATAVVFAFTVLN